MPPEERLGNYISVKPDGEEADFWITKDGKVTDKRVEKAYAIKVTNTDVFVPKYLYYALQNLFHNIKYHERMGQEKVTKKMIQEIQLQRR